MLQTYILLKNCSEGQKIAGLLEPQKSCSKSQKLLKSCQAQSGQAISGSATKCYGRVYTSHSQLNWFANNINSYSLSQNGWDRRALGSPCPLNVGVQDLVIERR